MEEQTVDQNKKGQMCWYCILAAAKGLIIGGNANSFWNIDGESYGIDAGV